MNSVAVFGSGYWGKNLIRNAHALQALRAVVKKRSGGEEQIREWAPGVPVHQDPERVWKDPGIRGVMIATPAETHYEVARQALEAGKDVFVEKPLTLKLDEGRDLVARAEKAGRILMVGHLLEYHPAILKIHELLRSGELGELRYVTSTRLNWGRFRSEENALWSLAPHDIGLILGLAGGLPARVIAGGGCFLQPGISDFAVAQMFFDDGARAHFFVSWLHPAKERRLVLVGSEKMAAFDDLSKELVLYDHAVEWTEGRPVAAPGKGTPVEFPAGEPLRVECEAFLESMKTRRPPTTDGPMGLRVLTVLDAAQRSLENDGAAVGIPEG